MWLIYDLLDAGFTWACLNHYTRLMLCFELNTHVTMLMLSRCNFYLDHHLSLVCLLLTFGNYHWSTQSTAETDENVISFPLIFHRGKVRITHTAFFVSPSEAQQLVAHHSAITLPKSLCSKRCGRLWAWTAATSATQAPLPSPKTPWSSSSAWISLCTSCTAWVRAPALTPSPSLMPSSSPGTVFILLHLDLTENFPALTNPWQFETHAWRWIRRMLFLPAVVVKRSRDARRSCTTRTRRETVRSASGAVTSSWVTSTCPTRQRRLSMQRAGCTQATWASTTRTDSSSSPEELKVGLLIPCRARYQSNRCICIESRRYSPLQSVSCYMDWISVSHRNIFLLSIKPVC